ncbi:hypothetical protein M501DRAFT_995806 [Patellaria atrata CBS 101060]|uniref:Uncharacterized protein n=1 Tax=Patellaria atrata CBS 101060 TaxID=1346257 RepID=A0A9P4S7I2_9PEZI|nr:hypothetical protein M501DRAFT_995806 [Patellaria atrata CBS 101060]
MAVPGSCTHRFKYIKSDTNLIMWSCNLCHSGPHWTIWECELCRLKTCTPCCNKA